MENLIDFNHWQGNQIGNDISAQVQEKRQLQVIEILKPAFGKDGNQYFFLLGENLQDGIAGFGNTVSEAVSDFYKSYLTVKA